MISKEQAINKIKDIQNNGLDNIRDADNIPRGIMALNLWNDVTFKFGIEYGAIIMLMRIFDIKKEEL